MSFQGSVSASERAIVRDTVRAAGITPARRRVLEHLANLGFYHRCGQGFFRKTVAAMAKAARCSERTVRAAIAEFRALGILNVEGRDDGGRSRATAYRLDLDAMIRAYKPGKVLTRLVRSTGDVLKVATKTLREIVEPLSKQVMESRQRERQRWVELGLLQPPSAGSLRSVSGARKPGNFCRGKKTHVNVGGRGQASEAPPLIDPGWWDAAAEASRWVPA